jgi:hypothetical protein
MEVLLLFSVILCLVAFYDISLCVGHFGKYEAVSDAVSARYLLLLSAAAQALYYISARNLPGLVAISVAYGLFLYIAYKLQELSLRAAGTWEGLA